MECPAGSHVQVYRQVNPESHGLAFYASAGLWAWSRHPNYFGEIVLWLGIALIALPSLSGWQYVTLISPLFVFLLITRVSGIPPLESRAEERWGDGPAFVAYKARTPVLIPRPPRWRAGISALCFLRLQRVDWVRQSRFFWINTSPVYHDGIRITAVDKRPDFNKRNN